MSRAEINCSGPTLVVVPLTKNLKKANSFRIKIPKEYIIAEAGERFMFLDCVALCDHIRVVNRNDLSRLMAKLATTAVYAVSAGLGYLFDY